MGADDKTATRPRRGPGQFAAFVVNIALCLLVGLVLAYWLRGLIEELDLEPPGLLLFALVALVVLAAYLWWVRPRSLRTLFARVSTARVTAIAFGIVALLGFALNDSGVTIPSMMAAVAEAVVVILLARVVFRDP